MGSSTYIFSNMDEYLTYYKSELAENDVMNMSCLRILDIYLKNSQIYFIVDSNNMIGKPNTTRSYIIIDKSMKEKLFNDSEILVKHEDVSYNPRNNHLEFMSGFLKKPKLWINVDRYFGEKPKKREKVNMAIKIYDFVLNRIILIQH
jgi:hypothetical protein